MRTTGRAGGAETPFQMGRLSASGFFWMGRAGGVETPFQMGLHMGPLFGSDVFSSLLPRGSSSSARPFLSGAVLPGLVLLGDVIWM